MKREEITSWDDDRLYDAFYPEKFQQNLKYAPVNYSYVQEELKKTGVTRYLLWEEYCKKCAEENAKACSYVTFTKNYSHIPLGGIIPVELSINQGERLVWSDNELYLCGDRGS